MFPENWTYILQAMIMVGSAAGGIFGGMKIKTIRDNNRNGNGNGNSKRPKLMSEETKAAMNCMKTEVHGDINKLWNDKRSREVCDEKHNAIGSRLGRIEGDLKDIKQDLRTLLRKTIE